MVWPISERLISINKIEKKTKSEKLLSKRANKRNHKLEARISQVRKLRKEPRNHKLEPLKYQNWEKNLETTSYNLSSIKAKTFDVKKS